MDSAFHVNGQHYSICVDEQNDFIGKFTASLVTVMVSINLFHPRRRIRLSMSYSTLFVASLLASQDWEPDISGKITATEF